MTGSRSAGIKIQETMFRAGRTVWRFVYLCSFARRVSGGIVVAAATGGAMVYKILYEPPVKLRGEFPTQDLS